MAKRLQIIRREIFISGCLILFSIFPVNAEEIFRWVDENGNISFSNVVPPSTGIEYTKKTTSSETDSTNKSTCPTVSSIIKADVIHKKESGVVEHQAIRKVLQKRIETGKRTIYKIESLLKRDPSDQTIRQHLFRKRMRLLEDINHLNDILSIK